MDYAKKTIEEAWDERARLNPANAPRPLREAVEAVVAGLDAGRLRVAEKSGGEWITHQWIKKAVLLSFRLNDNAPLQGGFAKFYDKVPNKFATWDAAAFAQSGVRVVPPAVARRGSFIAKNVVLMPSYVNIGAYVDEGTMVDTWATVGSCAQIGKNVHLSGGVGIGGVLEPPGARPVVVEDGAFVGSRCIVTEGTIVGAGAVLGANVVLTSSIPIIDVTGREPVEHRGYVPPRSVVIPGTRAKEYAAGTFDIPCALIVGTRNASTDLKTSLNDALREHGIAT